MLPRPVHRIGRGGTLTTDACSGFTMTFRVRDTTPPGRITIYFRQPPDVAVADTFLVTSK